jgi:hypothetical protein
MSTEHEAVQTTPVVDTMTMRRLAVEAMCDPRSIAAELAGRRVRGVVGERARAVLRAAGFPCVHRGSRKGRLKRRTPPSVSKPGGVRDARYGRNSSESAPTLPRDHSGATTASVD